MITIIGAGLAGLATAYRLQQNGFETEIFEARDFAGGRIQAAFGAEPANTISHQDLGPTWVWPYAQPLTGRWLDELNLATFEQFDSGSALVDIDPESAAQKQSLPSQFGSTRIVGGTAALVQKLREHITGPLNFNCKVKGCRYENNVWHVTREENSAQQQTVTTVTASQLIVATPLRIAAQLLDSETLEQSALLPLLQSVDTWMAPHAKVVMFYSNPFWREMGLSGRVVSRVGPLTEIHDHCGPDGSPAALFGFSGVPAATRHANPEGFMRAIHEQLNRCFDESAPQPERIVIKDWAYDGLTTTDDDRNAPGKHPPIVNKVIRQAHFNRSLWFAASESAQISPGLIEGALARADEIGRDFK